MGWVFCHRYVLIDAGVGAGAGAAGDGAGSRATATGVGMPTRRCTRGGILRMLGQNSLGLYVISELVHDTLESFCFGGRDVKHCTDGNTFEAVIQRALRVTVQTSRMLTTRGVSFCFYDF